MKKTNRITKASDFAIAIKKGKVQHSSNLTIHFIHTENNFLRIGLSVSTKLGNAVVRSRIKRQLRAMCDEIFNYTSSYDVVIVARTGFLNQSFQENKLLLSNLLCKQKGLIINEK